MFVAVCSVLCQAFSWVEQFLVAMPVRAALSNFSKAKNQIRGIDWRIRKNLKIALRVTGSEEVFFKSMAEGRNYIASLPEPSGLNCFECIMVVIVTLTLIRRWPVVPTAIGGDDRACAKHVGSCRLAPQTNSLAKLLAGPRLVAGKWWVGNFISG